MHSNSNDIQHPLIKASLSNLPLYGGGFSINIEATVSGYIQFEPNTRLMIGQQMPDLKSDSAQDYNNTRQFIKLDQAFRKLLKEYPEDFRDKTNYELTELMKLSADALLKIFPDKISLQLTEEGCIFYTIKKNNITIFFSHYLTANLNDLDESIITIYEGENNLLNYAGELWQTINEANKILRSFNIAIPEFV